MSSVRTGAWDELSPWHQVHFYKHTLGSPLGFLWHISTVCYFRMTLLSEILIMRACIFWGAVQEVFCAWINPLGSKLIIQWLIEKIYVGSRYGTAEYSAGQGLSSYCVCFIVNKHSALASTFSLNTLQSKRLNHGYRLNFSKSSSIKLSKRSWTGPSQHCSPSFLVFLLFGEGLRGHNRCFDQRE